MEKKNLVLLWTGVILITLVAFVSLYFTMSFHVKQEAIINGPSIVVSSYGKYAYDKDVYTTVEKADHLSEFLEIDPQTITLTNRHLTYIWHYQRGIISINLSIIFLDETCHITYVSTTENFNTRKNADIGDSLLCIDNEAMKEISDYLGLSLKFSGF